jgi:tRNA-modifying protein YgfZ
MIDLTNLVNRWYPLSDRAVFRLSGPDRVRFLNGQVTNDVRKVTKELSLPACLCSIKGKVEALVWITDLGESLLIDGELDQAEWIGQRLDRYLIADDCELHEETGQWKLIHHFVPGAGDPASRRLASSGFDRWKRSGDQGNEALFSEITRLAALEWEILAVRSVLPLAGQEITGNEFPAELGLDEWAVDFHKGCYLGQEIISRIESVGRVKRSLQAVRSLKKIGRGDLVRNSEGNFGQATRNFFTPDESVYGGLALFELDSRVIQNVDFEDVAPF